MNWDGAEGLFPYGPDDDKNSGWSGSDTSRERAEHDDHTGVTAKRQAEVLRLMATYGPKGVTWVDVSEVLHVHHGGASGVLSVLHKTGRIVRLSERRNRCKIYVLPEYAYGRATEKQGSTSANQLGDDIAALLRRLLPEHTDPVEAGVTCLHCEGVRLLSNYYARRNR